jgi:Uri superfamily endonuclease
MQNRKNIEIKIGKFGNLKISEGLYAYVGSAFGGGGINSRVSRHIKVNKKCRWHVDYLRRHMRMKEIWTHIGNRDNEHHFAKVLTTFSGAEIPMKGFGSSDCNCLTHLIKLSEVPEVFDEDFTILKF